MLRQLLTARGPAAYAEGTFRGVQVAIRPPRLGDAPAWSRARLAEEERLREAFADDPGEDWHSTQSELAFIERCARLRFAAARGLAHPGIIVGIPDGTDSAAQPTVFGEAGLDSVDPRTRTGELSVWISRSAPSARIARWASAAVILHAFTRPVPLLRVTSPFAAANRGPQAGLVQLGFQDEGLLRRYRLYAGSWADHRLFIVHNTPEARATLRRVVEPASR